jgi:carboxypeptidase PM20D1
VDTKGNLFCIFQAVEELIGEGVTPTCDVYIAAGSNEEVFGEGAPSTAAWLRSQNIRLRLVLDEGGRIMDKPMAGLRGIYGAVGVLEKGYGDVKLTAKSAGGHASTPVRNTPLVRLGKLMAAIDKKSPYKAKLNPTVLEMFKRFAPNADFGLRFVFTNLWLFKPVLPQLLCAVSPTAAAMVRTTIAFTTAKGSEGLNVLPQEAFVTANLRFIPHQDSEESLGILTALAKRYEIETEPLTVRSACPVVPHESDAFRLIEAVMAEVYPGVGVTPYVMTGGTDARNYTGICDNVLRFAPLYINGQQLKSIHGLDENIDCGALPPGVDFFRRLIQMA